MLATAQRDSWSLRFNYLCDLMNIGFQLLQELEALLNARRRQLLTCSSASMQIIYQRREGVRNRYNPRIK